MRGAKGFLILNSFFLFLAVAGGFYYYTETNPRAAPDNILIMSPRLASLIGKLPPALHLDNRSQYAECRINGALPDHACTPGAIFPEAGINEICTEGYTKTVRNVSVATKRRAYAEYGLSYPEPLGTYEVDHLIPLELGGNNDIANLFPEAAHPAPGFHEKDLVENYLHGRVCSGEISLAAAQFQIAADWTDVYNALTPAQIEWLEKEFSSYGN